MLRLKQNSRLKAGGGDAKSLFLFRILFHLLLIHYNKANSRAVNRYEKEAVH